MTIVVNGETYAVTECEYEPATGMWVATIDHHVGDPSENFCAYGEGDTLDGAIRELGASARRIILGRIGGYPD